MMNQGKPPPRKPGRVDALLAAWPSGGAPHASSGTRRRSRSSTRASSGEAGPLRSFPRVSDEDLLRAPLPELPGEVQSSAPHRNGERGNRHDDGFEGAGPRGLQGSGEAGADDAAAAVGRDAVRAALLERELFGRGEEGRLGPHQPGRAGRAGGFRRPCRRRRRLRQPCPRRWPRCGRRRSARQSGRLRRWPRPGRSRAGGSPSGASWRWRRWPQAPSSGRSGQSAPAPRRRSPWPLSRPPSCRRPSCRRIHRSPRRSRHPTAASIRRRCRKPRRAWLTRRLPRQPSPSRCRRLRLLQRPILRRLRWSPRRRPPPRARAHRTSRRSCSRRRASPPALQRQRRPPRWTPPRQRLPAASRSSPPWGPSRGPSAPLCRALAAASGRTTRSPTRRVTFKSDGTVQSVSVSGGAAGKPAEACIRSALSKARIPPFAQPTFTAPTTVRPN